MEHILLFIQDLWGHIYSETGNTTGGCNCILSLYILKYCDTCFLAGNLVDAFLLSSQLPRSIRVQHCNGNSVLQEASPCPLFLENSPLQLQNLTHIFTFRRIILDHFNNFCIVIINMTRAKHNCAKRVSSPRAAMVILHSQWATSEMCLAWHAP